MHAQTNQHVRTGITTQPLSFLACPTTSGLSKLLKKHVFTSAKWIHMSHKCTYRKRERVLSRILCVCTPENVLHGSPWPQQSVQKKIKGKQQTKSLQGQDSFESSLDCLFSFRLQPPLIVLGDPQRLSCSNVLVDNVCPANAGRNSTR